MVTKLSERYSFDVRTQTNTELQETYNSTTYEKLSKHSVTKMDLHPSLARILSLGSQCELEA